MPTSREPKPLNRRAQLAKDRAEAQKVLKLHVIAERRARAHGMDKQTFIAEIVKGNFRPITAADIAAEPDIVAPDVVAPDVVAPAEPLLAPAAAPVAE